MRPYSKDLRDRVAATIDEGEGSLRQIAHRFLVSLSFVARLLRRRRQTGSLDPAPHLVIKQLFVQVCTTWRCPAWRLSVVASGSSNMR